MNRVFQSLSVAALCLVVANFVTGCGEVRGPFAKDKPVVSTPVPADFAVVIDESADNQYARQEVRQVVTNSDLMSRVTYVSRRDFNDTISNQYTQAYPLNKAQVQAMWDQVVKYNLMENPSVWYYWETNTNNYRRSERVIQIRANGKKVVFKLLNHWGYKLRDLAFLVESARFPKSDAVNAPQPIIEPAATIPAATKPEATPTVSSNSVVDVKAGQDKVDDATPATAPATAPAMTMPANK